LSIIVTLAFFTVVSLKLLAAAHGSITSAVAVLNVAGPVDVAIGSGLKLGPLLLALLPGAPLLLLGRDIRGGQQVSNWALYGWVGLAYVPVILLSPWTLGVAVLGTVVVFPGLSFLGTRLLRRFLPPPEEDKRIAILRAVEIVIVVSIVVFFFIIVLSEDVWLPAEHVTFRTEGHSQDTVGYVLGDSSSELTVLTEARRMVVHYSDPRTLNRTLCRPRGARAIEDQPSILFVLFGGPRPHYPECPKTPD
jgi:hypothetical protein